MPTDVSDVLTTLASEFATAIPEVDAHNAHERWKPEIGPFEEHIQVDMIHEAIEDASFGKRLRTERSYPTQRQKCDLVVTQEDMEIPVEAKLLRFRYDNGNINPSSFAKIFSPFPERSSSSLLTDAKKLHESEFSRSGGLLGLYHEKEDELYEEMNAEMIAEKFAIDVGYWYDFEVKTAAVEEFDGLRHPHHQRGAVITWEIQDP